MLACRGGLPTVGLRSPDATREDVEAKPKPGDVCVGQPVKPAKREGLEEECGLPTLLSWGVPWPEMVRRCAARKDAALFSSSVRDAVVARALVSGMKSRRPEGRRRSSLSGSSSSSEYSKD